MIPETPEERKARFKIMSSTDRKALIRAKMKAEGLEEGSGVPGKTYNNEEVLDLIGIMRCFSGMQGNQAKTQ